MRCRYFALVTGDRIARIKREYGSIGISSFSDIESSAGSLNAWFSYDIFDVGSTILFLIAYLLG
jgi:hypothetical protein